MIKFGKALKVADAIGLRYTISNLWNHPTPAGGTEPGRSYFSRGVMLCHEGDSAMDIYHEIGHYITAPANERRLRNTGHDLMGRKQEWFRSQNREELACYVGFYLAYCMGVSQRTIKDTVNLYSFMEKPAILIEYGKNFLATKQKRMYTKIQSIAKRRDDV